MTIPTPLPMDEQERATLLAKLAAIEAERDQLRTELEGIGRDRSIDNLLSPSATLRELESTPVGFRPCDLPPDEAQARYRLLQSARAYGDALEANARLSELGNAYRRDLKAYRTVIWG